MTHEPKTDRDLDYTPVVPADRAHADGATASMRISDDPQAIYDKIEAFAKHGTGSSRDLATLVASLTNELKTQVRELIPELAKRISGDVILQIGEIVLYPISFTIKSAKEAHPAVTSDQLQAYLRTVSASTIAELGDDTALFETIRKLLPGRFAVELPRLAEFPAPLHGKPLFVAWYVAMTDKTIVALNFAGAATPALAASLTHLDYWSWLDDLHVGHGFRYGTGLEILRDAAPEKIKPKIQHVLGAFDSKTITVQDSEVATKELVARAETTGDTPGFLDAGARAYAVNASDRDKVVKRLEGEPSSVVLEFAAATSLELEASLPLLLRSTGATTEQIQTLMLQHNADERAAALNDAKVRATLRKIVGAKLPLTLFFPEVADRELAHDVLFGDAALREWAYQDKSPATYLWLAAGSASAKDACKIVRREVGLDWVQHLSTTAPDIELRRFILNCDDPKQTKFVREHLLADRTFKVSDDASQVETVSTEVYGRGDKARLEVAELRPKPGEKPDPTTVLDRLSDMTPPERTALLGDAYEMQNLFAVVQDDAAVRAVFLLGPTIAQLFKLPVSNERRLLDYLRTRPPQEEQLALAQGPLVARARSLFGQTSPFVVHPSLYDPNAMAKALGTSPDLLAWMIDDSDPSLVLSYLAREPVRAIAMPLFEARAHVYDKLPQYKQLSAAGKRGFDTLTKKPEDDTTAQDAERYKAGEAPVDGVAEKHGERMATASASKHLWDAIDVLSLTDAASALTIVNNASAADRIALLDGSHTPSVAHLKQIVDMSPHHVFPTLTTAQLLAMRDAATWLFETEPPYVTLARIQFEPKGLDQLANALDANLAFARKWISGLPVGSNLAANERIALDAMCSHVANEQVLSLLFAARYGTAVDGSFKLAEMKRLWGVLARLPPAQVNQKVIQGMTHGEMGPDVAGLWDQKNVVLAEDRHKLEGTDPSYEDSPLLGAAEIKKYYGLDDAGLALASAENGWITRENDKYRVKPVTTEQQFDSTVLHEVGHSVDTLLGEHTELIYGLGGWKQYGVDQFEEWAAEMGGLKGITGSDREEIISVWKNALRVSQPVSAMVDKKHPALADKYAADPLVNQARQGNRFYYKEAPRPSFNGRVFVTNGGFLNSVPTSTNDVAPSQYAMSASAEFFAESYVEYYRLYQGTPETAKLKGGHLAGWIKDWFDKNVDTIQLSPQRLHGNMASGDAKKKTT